MIRACAFLLLLTTFCVAAASGAKPRKSRRPAKRPPAVAPAKPPRAETAPEPRKEQPVPFQVGETLSYDVGWSSYVTAGNATITVQQKKPSYGSTAYYIAAEGRPSSLLAKFYTLYYKVDTLLDV